jgi:hypothetical protein
MKQQQARDINRILNDVIRNEIESILSSYEADSENGIKKAILSRKPEYWVNSYHLSTQETTLITRTAVDAVCASVFS